MGGGALRRNIQRCEHSWGQSAEWHCCRDKGMQAGDQERAPAWEGLNVYREGNGEHPDEDTPRTEDKTGHRGCQNHGMEFKGAVGLQDTVRQVKSCKWQRGKEPGNVTRALHRESCDVNLGLLAPVPGLFPLATSHCLKSTQSHEWPSCLSQTGWLELHHRGHGMTINSFRNRKSLCHREAVSSFPCEL